MAVMLTLTAITGSHISKQLTLTERVTKIGSAASNDIVLHDRQIEPRHLEVHQILERWFVVPLTPASQGISLNGMPISGRSRLNPGDILTVGAISYRVAVAEMMEQAVGTAPASASAQGVPRIGEYFIRRGLMTSEDVTRTAKRQSELQRSGNRTSFGQVAYELGYINRSQLDAALADQRNDFNERFRD